MKRNFIYLLILLLCSCSSDSDDNSVIMEEEEQQTESQTEQGSDESTDEDSSESETVSTLSGEPVGFATLGTTPTGGEGGESVVVTTASELTAALKKSGSLIIYVKGTISVSSVISVQASDKTLLGLTGSVLTNPNRTQDESGILYFKEGSDNLILRNLTFQSAGAYDTDGWDNLCIDKTTNIWVDHCDFQDGVDGNFDCKNASDYIAVTWCRFRYLIDPLAGGPGGSDDHRYSNLWGNSDSRTTDRDHLNTTFQYCWWDEGCVDRMPRVRFAKIHLANCLFSSSVASGCIGLGREADVYVEKCVFSGIKRPYKTYSYTDDDGISVTDGIINFDGCLFQNSTEPTDVGTAFTPEYTLEMSDVSEVEELVSAGAGATLQIDEPK